MEKECLVGHYCLGGSNDKKLCEPGSYNRIPGEFSCLTCAAGQYCPGGFQMMPCPDEDGWFKLETGLSECKQYDASAGNYIRREDEEEV